jgi:hypothetical protein
MFVEKAATSEQGITLQSRPGLSTSSTVGSGPINGLFTNPGLFGGDLFSVSGSTLYRATTSKGTVSGSGATSIAGSSDGVTSELLIARGSDLYRFDGTTLSTVTFPDSASVRAVCFIGSLFVAVRGDGAHPGRFYWSAPLDGSSWDALSFATAERGPDDLLDIAALNDKIILYGQSTIEVWSHTGDADLPFTRVEGIGSQSKGIHSTGAKCEADNTLFHVGSDGGVYRLGDGFDLISEHWLEEKVAASTAVSLFAFRWQGHEFACVRLDSQTFAYDCATQSWCEFQTNGSNWNVKCAVMSGRTAYLGNATNGTVMTLSGWTDQGVTLTREFTAALQMDSVGSVNNLWLWAETGKSTVLSGTGSDPKVEQQYSRDAGETWSDFNDAALGNASLGGTGQYRVIPEWRRLGQFDAPGAIFRFRTTDPVPFSIRAVKYNEPVFGRSRG